MIPIAGSIISGAEGIFNIIYSEEFNQALNDYANYEYGLIPENCQSEDCIRRREELLNLISISEEMIDDIRNIFENNNHICTCTCSEN